MGHRDHTQHQNRVEYFFILLVLSVMVHTCHFNTEVEARRVKSSKLSSAIKDPTFKKYPPPPPKKKKRKPSVPFVNAILGLSHMDCCH